MTVSLRGEKPGLSCCSAATFPPQACRDHLDVFWQYFSFMAEEIRSTGKHWDVLSLGGIGQCKLCGLFPLQFEPASQYTHTRLNRRQDHDENTQNTPITKSVFFPYLYSDIHLRGHKEKNFSRCTIFRTTQKQTQQPFLPEHVTAVVTEVWGQKGLILPTRTFDHCKLWKLMKIINPPISQTSNRSWHYNKCESIFKSFLIMKYELWPVRFVSFLFHLSIWYN